MQDNQPGEFYCKSFIEGILKNVEHGDYLANKTKFKNAASLWESFVE